MDSETRRKMNEILKTVADEKQVFKQITEDFTDWVYDLAYRKGWQDGYWRQDVDLSYQTAFLKRRKDK